MSLRVTKRVEGPSIVVLRNALILRKTASAGVVGERWRTVKEVPLGLTQRIEKGGI